MVHALNLGMQKAEAGQFVYVEATQKDPVPSKQIKLGMLIQAHNFSTWEAKAGDCPMF